MTPSTQIQVLKNLVISVERFRSYSLTTAGSGYWSGFASIATKLVKGA